MILQSNSLESSISLILTLFDPLQSVAFYMKAQRSNTKCLPVRHRRHCNSSGSASPRIPLAVAQTCLTHVAILCHAFPRVPNDLLQDPPSNEICALSKLHWSIYIYIHTYASTLVNVRRLLPYFSFSPRILKHAVRKIFTPVDYISSSFRHSRSLNMLRLCCVPERTSLQQLPFNPPSSYCPPWTAHTRSSPASNFTQNVWNIIVGLTDPRGAQALHSTVNAVIWTYHICFFFFKIKHLMDFLISYSQLS